MSASSNGARGSIPTRGPIWAKFMIGVGAVLMVVAGGGAVYAKTLLDRVNNASEERDLLGDGDSAAGEDVKGPMNLLMIGTDLRVNDNDGIDRADSIMILHINEDLTKANIISFPRDLKVPIPKCSTGEPCEDKINSAYEAGGDTPEDRFQNLAATLSDLTGIEHFDGAAIIGFEGFLKAVKTMGSVELCLPIDMSLEQEKLDKDGGTGKIFPKGCNEYDQQEALWIVRERYAYDALNPEFDQSWGVGDYGRQHMQQHFIKQLLVKAGEEGYITDPTKVGDLISEVGSAITIDLNGHSVTDFAVALRGIKPEALRTVRLPSDTSVEYDMNGVEVDYEVIAPGEPTEITEDLFKAIRDDTITQWIDDNPDLVNKE